MVAHRHLAAGAEQAVEAVDQRQVVEGGIDLGGRDDLHEKGPRVPDGMESPAETRAACRSIAFCSRGAGPLAGAAAVDRAASRRRWTSRSSRVASPLASRARLRW